MEQKNQNNIEVNPIIIERNDGLFPIERINFSTNQSIKNKIINLSNISEIRTIEYVSYQQALQGACGNIINKLKVNDEDIKKIFHLDKNITTGWFVIQNVYSNLVYKLLFYLFVIVFLLASAFNAYDTIVFLDKKYVLINIAILMVNFIQILQGCTCFWLIHYKCWYDLAYTSSFIKAVTISYSILLCCFMEVSYGHESNQDNLHNILISVIGPMRILMTALFYLEMGAHLEKHHRNIKVVSSMAGTCQSFLELVNEETRRSRLVICRNELYRIMVDHCDFTKWKWMKLNLFIMFLASFISVILFSAYLYSDNNFASELRWYTTVYLSMVLMHSWIMNLLLVHYCQIVVDYQNDLSQFFDVEHFVAWKILLGSLWDRMLLLPIKGSNTKSGVEVQLTILLLNLCLLIVTSL